MIASAYLLRSNEKIAWWNYTYSLKLPFGDDSIVAGYGGPAVCTCTKEPVKWIVIFVFLRSSGL